jgi:LacI family transcriptional regulator
MNPSLKPFNNWLKGFNEEFLMGAKSVSIVQVAREAGVALGTASMALSGDARIAPGTSQRVKQAAARLGYRPNRGARGLVMNKSFLLGLVAPQSQFRVMEVLAGAQAEAIRHRYSVLTFVHDDTLAEERRHLQLALDCKVDGLMVMPTVALDGGHNARLLEEISADQCRVIQLNHRISDSLTAVRTDYAASGRKLTERLIALGHRRIVHFTHTEFDQIGPAQPFVASWAVAQGYQKAMEHAGLPPIFVTELLDELDSHDERRLAAIDRSLDQSLSGPSPATAIFSRFATEAILLATSARNRGLEMPQDLSIVGASDNNVASLPWPAITVSREPYEKIGMAAVELLLNPTEKNAGDVDLLIQPELLIRQSDVSPKEGSP